MDVTAIDMIEFVLLRTALQYTHLKLLWISRRNEEILTHVVS